MPADYIPPPPDEDEGLEEDETKDVSRPIIDSWLAVDALCVAAV